MGPLVLAKQYQLQLSEFRVAEAEKRHWSGSRRAVGDP